MPMAVLVLHPPCGSSIRGMRKIATFGTVLCLGVLATTADTADERKKRVEQELRNVPAPELPARAAEVVRNTPAAERSQAAVIAVETAIQRNPTAGASVLAAISKAAPETRFAAAAAIEKAKSKGDKEKPRGNSEGHGNPGSGSSGSGDQNDSADRDAREVRRTEANSRGHANGGVGHGPGPNKPGRQIPEKPHNSVLPNGKPRHYPPNPPNRPVDPPRPHKYNKPRHN